MNCDCIDQLKDQVKEKYTSGKEIAEGSAKVNCEEEQFYIGMQRGLALRFNVEYRKLKVNGRPYARKNKERMSVKCKFCPICGDLLERGETIMNFLTNMILDKNNKYEKIQIINERGTEVEEFVDDLETFGFSDMIDQEILNQEIVRVIERGGEYMTAVIEYHKGSEK